MEFLPNARIGIIQGPKIDIENKDIVLSMLQSLSIKTYENKVFENFGLAIVDECHHIAAEVFSRALSKINSFYLWVCILPSVLHWTPLGTDDWIVCPWESNWLRCAKYRGIWVWCIMGTLSAKRFVFHGKTVTI